MGKSRACTSKMAQELTEFNLVEASANAGHNFLLKNALERNFFASTKVNFSSPKQASHVIPAITIPMQLMESNSEAQKLQNDHQGFLA